MSFSTSIPRRKIVTNSHLKNYLITAGAATAAFAVAGSADADIINSTGSTSVVQNAADFTLFSFNGAKVKARNVWNRSASISAYTYATAHIQATNVNFQLASISDGITISNIMTFGGSTERNNRSAVSGVITSSGNDLALASNKLVAFRVTNGGDSYYGWLDYSLAFLSLDDGYTFTVNGWAYNDVSGQGIIAGQNTAAGSNAVPGLGGLAALAIGAAGVRSRRQRTVA
jgi:hypothetical protein